MYIEGYDFMKNEISVVQGDGPMSIVSEDCFGAHIYQFLNIKYTTPFIWVGIRNDYEYIKMLSNLEYYLSLSLNFIQTDFPYPVAKLGDITVFFGHCSSEENAKFKWETRLQRFNFDNIIVKFASDDKNTLLEFDKLQIKNKIAFTPQDYGLSCGYVLNGYFENEELRSLYERNWGSFAFRAYVRNCAFGVIPSLPCIENFDYKEWLFGK